MEKIIYNPGDRVRVIARKWGHNFEIGQIITLKHYTGDDWRCESGGDQWYLKESEFEPVD
jgi:hypothetical protein